MKDSAEMFVMFQAYKTLKCFIFGSQGEKKSILPWGYSRGFMEYRQDSENTTSNSFPS